MYSEDRIREHYKHAREKHPFFADRICDARPEGEYTVDAEELKLRMSGGAEYTADDVLAAELAEVYEAACDGNRERFEEEVYDAVAVLLRMLDLYGEQEENRC